MLPFRNPEPTTSSEQGEEERPVERHGDVTGAHAQGADHHAVALPDPTVGDHPAEQRREVDEPGVETENLRRERLRRQRADDRFHRGTESGEPGNLLDMPRQQQLVHHVEGEQRRHPVVGEAFPRFGEGQVEQASGMTQESVVSGARGRGLLVVMGPRLVLTAAPSCSAAVERVAVRLVERVRVGAPIGRRHD